MPIDHGPMRLAMFSYGLPVPGQKRGGIERAAHVLAQGLAERGHSVVVFSHDPRPGDAAMKCDHCRGGSSSTHGSAGA